VLLSYLILPLNLMKQVYALAAVLFISCNKDKDPKIVEVTKETAWREVTSLYRTGRVIQNMAGDGNTIFLQQLNYFTPITNSKAIPLTYVTGVTDVQVRIPIAPRFYVTASDTIVRFWKTAEPLASDVYPGKAYLSVKKLDPAARKVTKSLTSFGYISPFSSIVINKNNYVLLHYSTADEYPSQTTSANFILAAVDPNTREGNAPRLLSAQRITLPVNSNRGSYNFKSIVSIDDYFLVSFDGALYKIYQNGIVKQVAKLFDNYDGAYSLYKWQGRLYCIAFNNTLVSETDGETWHTYTQIPNDLLPSRPYPVGDSLVCAVGENLVSWRWRGASASFRVLNNEGLERSLINGIQVLHDTVYVGTSNGLFVRPLKKFFESKPKD
jgi:hypothetical protein